MGSKYLKRVLDRLADHPEALHGDGDWLTLAVIAWRVPDSKSYLTAEMSTVGAWIGHSGSEAWRRVQRLVEVGALRRPDGGPSKGGRGNTVPYLLLLDGTWEETSRHGREVSDGEKRSEQTEIQRSDEEGETSRAGRDTTSRADREQGVSSYSEEVRGDDHEDVAVDDLEPGGSSSPSSEKSSEESEAGTTHLRCPECSGLIVMPIGEIDERGSKRFACRKCGHSFDALEDEEKLVAWMVEHGVEIGAGEEE